MTTRHSTLDVFRRTDAELDAGAELNIVKKDGVVIVTYTGGTQVCGGSMSAGDSLHEALECAFDMDVEGDDETCGGCGASANAPCDADCGTRDD